MISDGNNGDTGSEYPLSRRKGERTLEQKAARLGWNIPEDKKNEIVQRQIEIATTSTEERYASIAAKTLVAMNSQNVTLAVSRVEEPTEKAAPVPLETLLEMRKRTVAD